MKQKIICKTLAVGVIILFVGVGVQPAIAQKDITDSEEERNKNVKSIGLGFIICQITSLYFWYYGPFFVVPVPLIPITCEDLDSGSKRIGITRLFGFHIFKFLPIGHDYKLTFYTSPKIERLILNFDGYEIIKVKD